MIHNYLLQDLMLSKIQSKYYQVKIRNQIQCMFLRFNPRINLFPVASSLDIISSKNNLLGIKIANQKNILKRLLSFEYFFLIDITPTKALYFSLPTMAKVKTTTICINYRQNLLSSVMYGAWLFNILTIFIDRIFPIVV